MQTLTEDLRRLYRCRTIKNCTVNCPKSLDPANSIHKMKTRHLASPPSRSEVLKIFSVESLQLAQRGYTANIKISQNKQVQHHPSTF